jgi:hypothetical protein
VRVLWSWRGLDAEGMGHEARVEPEREHALQRGDFILDGAGGGHGVEPLATIRHDAGGGDVQSPIGAEGRTEMLEGGAEPLQDGDVGTHEDVDVGVSDAP